MNGKEKGPAQCRAFFGVLPNCGGTAIPPEDRQLLDAVPADAPTTPVLEFIGDALSSRSERCTNQKAMDAAKSLGMNPPSAPNAKQKADYDKMSKKSAGLGYN